MHIPYDDTYFDTLAQHANALIPALGGVEEDEEEEGVFLAHMDLGQIRRFFFHPARTPEERTLKVSGRTRAAFVYRSSAAT